MDITITDTKEVPALHRKEIVARAYFDGPTLSRKEVKANLSKELKVDENLLLVEKIETTFGDKAAKITAFVYENEEMKKKLAEEHLIKKNTFDAAAKEEAPKEAAAPVEEKPAEEAPKEEAPKEEVPKEEAPAEEKKPEEKPKAEEPAEEKKEE